MGAVPQYGTLLSFLRAYDAECFVSDHLFTAGPRSSAVVGGYTFLHEELERRLADLKGTEDCLLFPTGFAANVAAVSALCSDAAVSIFSDELNHASIIDGARLASRRQVSLPARAAAICISQASLCSWYIHREDMSSSPGSTILLTAVMCAHHYEIMEASVSSLLSRLHHALHMLSVTASGLLPFRLRCLDVPAGEALSVPPQ